MFLIDCGALENNTLPDSLSSVDLLFTRASPVTATDYWPDTTISGSNQSG